ncbi:heavy metal transporter [Streptomyces sp. NPDC048290]|uniref:heavy metal transporter n=1 Tax=Streptomyces sp. NPDC048290 TaxID=3155811 RepID=UPI003435AE59
MSQPYPSRKLHGRLLRCGTAFLAILAVAGYLVVQYVTGASGAHCKVVAANGTGGTYDFTPEQAVNAAAVSAVGTGRGLPGRAVTIALATALQESALRNLDHGDRDSLGLFQQRPSQGWGTERQIMDPVYAANAFYDHLEQVDGYTELPLTVAAQRVQRSGFPTAYAQHEADAQLLADAFTGRAAATLTCGGRPDVTRTPAPEQLRAAGPDVVRSALVRDFGQLERAGAAAGAGAGTDADRVPAPGPAGVTAETSGRTVTVPVVDGSGEEQGWRFAHWAVANASELGIESVSYAGREWTAGSSENPWADGAGGSRDTVRIVTVR